MKMYGFAIADLQLKNANVEVQRAGLERRYSEVQDQMRQRILSLVLEYEATERQIAFIINQLNDHRILFKVMEIDYRFGGSSTDTYLREHLFNGEQIELHHRQRLADGGSDNEDNLMLVHKSCHSKIHSGSRA